MKQTWILEREIKWQMGHALINGPIHGHEFSASIQLEYTKLNASSMGVDFTEMKNVEEWIEGNWNNVTLLPYNHLALQPYIQGEEEWDPVIDEIGFVPVPFNPTCEMLAVQLSMIVSDLMHLPIENVAIKISDGSKNSCLYLIENELDYQNRLDKLQNLLRGVNIDE
jgi:6-pyruvoyl-tetrahydropterin synthase